MKYQRGDDHEARLRRIGAQWRRSAAKKGSRSLSNKHRAQRSGKPSPD